MKISVVIQSHNRPRGLSRLLSALECQTLPLSTFEVVISDDSDDMTAIEAALASRRLNINYRHTPPCGAAESMQEALSRAQGEYIKIIHDDDLVTPFSLEDSMNALDTVRNANIVVNQAIIRYPFNDVLRYNFSEENSTMPSADFANHYAQSPPGAFQTPVLAMYRRHPRFRAFWEYENLELREHARKTGAGTDVQLQVESALSNELVAFIPRANSILCTDLGSITAFTPGIGRWYDLWAAEYRSDPPWKLFR